MAHAQFDGLMTADPMPTHEDVGRAVRVIGYEGHLGWLLQLSNDGAEALVSFDDGRKALVPTAAVAVTRKLHAAIDWSHHRPDCPRGKMMMARVGARYGEQPHDHCGVLVVTGPARETTTTIPAPMPANEGGGER